MLTSDLVLARVYRKKVRPRFVGDRDRDLSGPLESLGQRRDCPSRLAIDSFERIDTPQPNSMS